MISPAPHLFLSYASADRERALAIADALEAAGISVWIDRRGIPGGTDWAGQITQAVRLCSAVAVLCSHTSVASRNVRQELQLAWDHIKPILPLLLEPVEFLDSVAYFLQGRQWIEIYDRTNGDWVPDVVRALGGILEEPATAPAQPVTSMIPSGNLPAPATPMVGRQDEVAGIVKLLSREDVRLVTLTGPGGVGKTRLSIAAAEQLTSSFPDGVWFVRLAPIRDPALVVPTIAETLAIRDEGNVSQVERLHAFLRGKHLLLVIDNVEHVIEAASELAELLTQGSGVKMLATSRTVLRLTGETELLVDPLSAPDQDGQLTATEAEAFASVRLFVQRAAAAKPGFALTEENAPAIAAICARLDGLPLAIEIAAARVKLIPPAGLLARLEKRLPLLTGGSRDLPARQQTLRDAIAWSYDLLTPDERVLFCRLSVFVGGCTLEAAESVTGPGLGVDTFDGLASLVDKSLLRLDETTEKPRFRMLETIRELAVEQLELSAEAEASRDRHADWCLRLADETNSGVRFMPTVDQLARASVEHDNLRAALAYLELHERGESLLHLVTALGGFWEFRGYRIEGQHWVARALALGEGAPSSLYRSALLVAGSFAYRQGDNGRAIELAEQSLALGASPPDQWSNAYAYFSLAACQVSSGEFGMSIPYLEAAAAGFRDADDPVWIGLVSHQRGVAAFGEGDIEEATGWLEQSIEMAREQGGELTLAFALDYLALVSAVAGDIRRAVRLLEESSDSWQAFETNERLSNWLMRVAFTTLTHGRAERCARLVGAAEAMRDSLGAIWELPERTYYERTIQSLRDEMGAEAYEAAWADGSNLTMEQACAEGLALLRTLGSSADA